VAEPKSSVAWLRSDSSSRSFSRRALARGSSTASSSYSTGLPPAARRASRAASFSASFCFRVPFFFGGATGAEAGAGVGLSSSEEASQSLCEIDHPWQDQSTVWVKKSRFTHNGLVIILSLPFTLDFAGYVTRRRVVVRTLCPDCQLGSGWGGGRSGREKSDLPQSDIVIWLVNEAKDVRKVGAAEQQRRIDYSQVEEEKQKDGNGKR
jgi:hypothetical protein